MILKVKITIMSAILTAEKTVTIIMMHAKAAMKIIIDRQGMSTKIIIGGVRAEPDVLSIGADSL